MAMYCKVFWRCILLVACLFVFTSRTVFGHGHDHGHGHGHSHGSEDHSDDHHNEIPSFKYSRQANEPRHQQNHHGHSHGDHHEHGHGHSHTEEDPSYAHGHGHSHGDHEQSHETNHGHLKNGHGHSHDAHGHGHNVHEHEHGNVPKDDITHKIPVSDSEKVSTGYSLWLKALGSTMIISAAPLFILLVIPLDNSPAHQPRLKVLLSFASGGLLGDAFLHLIPHAISPHVHGADEHLHSHDESSNAHNHSHDMSVGLAVLSGIVTFLIVEKLVRFVKEGHGHGHSHSHHVELKDTDKGKHTKDTSKDKKDEKTNKEETSSQEVAEKKTCDNEQEGIKVSGFLNLAADFMHNFTDGLAIGASYLAGNKVGMLTTFIILIHEVPHEIGDFAILVQSGCSKRKAMLLQLSTAVGAMLGTVVSLFTEGVSQMATAQILPFTAGGFIYIATVSVIPELLQDSKLWQTAKEIAALLIGITLMVYVAD